MEANTPFSASPPDWPQQAEEDYQRIRILGAGAFGQVLLGKRRAENKHCPEEYVAIKGVSILTENEGATAAREIAILSELSHPNVIKLLDAYDPASSTAKGRYMVMSYIDGPDVSSNPQPKAFSLSLSFYILIRAMLTADRRSVGKTRSISAAISSISR